MSEGKAKALCDQIHKLLDISGYTQPSHLQRKELETINVIASVDGLTEQGLKYCQAEVNAIEINVINNRN